MCVEKPSPTSPGRTSAKGSSVSSEMQIQLVEQEERALEADLQSAQLQAKVEHLRLRKLKLNASRSSGSLASSRMSTMSLDALGRLRESTKILGHAGGHEGPPANAQSVIWQAPPMNRHSEAPDQYLSANRLGIHETNGAAGPMGPVAIPSASSTSGGVMPNAFATPSGAGNGPIGPGPAQATQQLNVLNVTNINPGNAETLAAHHKVVTAMAADVEAHTAQTVIAEAERRHQASEQTLIAKAEKLHTEEVHALAAAAERQQLETTQRLEAVAERKHHTTEQHAVSQVKAQADLLHSNRMGAVQADHSRVLHDEAIEHALQLSELNAYHEATLLAQAAAAGQQCQGLTVAAEGEIGQLRSQLEYAKRYCDGVLEREKSAEAEAEKWKAVAGRATAAAQHSASCQQQVPSSTTPLEISNISVNSPQFGNSPDESTSIAPLGNLLTLGPRDQLDAHQWYADAAKSGTVSSGGQFPSGGDEARVPVVVREPKNGHVKYTYTGSPLREYIWMVF